MTKAFEARKKDVKTRIFLLTDGQVNNREQITKLIQKSCEKYDDTKVFSFGIGSGCDSYLVEGCAKNGNGDFCIIADNDPKLLKSKVIGSLRKASEPSLQNCTFSFGQSQCELGSLWRNEIVKQYKILSEDEFEKLECTFKCKFDPKTKGPWEQKYDKSHF